MFTRDLEMCLMAAQSEAKDRHHEYLCVEHILYALLHHDTGIRIIKSCGGNVDRIKQDLEEFFSQQETVGEDNSPQQTRAIQVWYCSWGTAFASRIRHCPQKLFITAPQFGMLGWTDRR